jgi:hypothetical protein
MVSARTPPCDEFPFLFSVIIIIIIIIIAAAAAVVVVVCCYSCMLWLVGLLSQSQLPEARC